MGRDEGMWGGLQLQREGRGGEGWEKGKEVKGPSREQGRAVVMTTRVEGKKKTRNKNKSVKKEGKNKPMACWGWGSSPCAAGGSGGHLLRVRPRGRSIPAGSQHPSRPSPPDF